MDKLEKTLAWALGLLIPGGLAVAAVVSNASGSNNPGNLTGSGYLGQTGNFGQKNLAQFRTLMLGVAANSKNFIGLNNNHPGLTYYQLAQLWASGSPDGKPDYGQAVIDEMGVDDQAQPATLPLPWEIASFLQGVFVAEGSDSVNPVTLYEGVLLGYL